MNIEAFRAYFSDTAAQDADSVYYVQFSPLCRILQVTEDIKTELHLHDEQALPYGKLLGLMGQSDDPLMLQLYLTAAVLALLVAAAGVLMIEMCIRDSLAPLRPAFQPFDPPKVSLAILAPLRPAFWLFRPCEVSLAPLAPLRPVF